MEGTIQPKKYLTVKEFADYVGIGTTKARELIRRPSCEYSLKLGGKWMIIKDEFDRVAKRNAKFNIAM